VERPGCAGIFDQKLEVERKRQKLAQQAKCADTDDPEENAAQKEKGRNRGLTADSPESYCTKMRLN
jgi:hypothetical protein